MRRSGPARLIAVALCALSLPSFSLESTAATLPSQFPVAHMRAEGSRNLVRTSAGLTFTVWGLKQTYQRDELVRLRLTVTNRSRPSIRVSDYCPLAPSSLRLEVLDSTGRSVYPPPLQPFAFPGCAGAPLQAFPLLAPGHTFSTRVYVVMRTGHLRAAISLLRGKGVPFTVATRPFSVHLTPSQPPRVVVHTNGQVDADVQPKAHLHRPPLYVDSAICPFGRGEDVPSQLIWERAVGRRIYPGCEPAARWRLVVGWLNHPVATVDYAAPGASTLPDRTRASQ